MYWIDKVIDEIKWRCGSKYNIDGIQWMINSLKHPSVPAPDEGVAVVEIETEPVEVTEEHKGEAEEPKLPDEGKEVCPKCNQEPCVCEEDSEETPAEVETKEEEAVEETGDKLEETTPEEEDRMNKILDAIKTFFPNENTEDVLVRIVSKLIDR